jgi:regulator of replication initiation timing
MDRLDAAKSSKQAADDSLASANAKVAEVRAKLDALAAQLQEAVDEKNAVELQAKYLKNRGNLADRLINGLASEKVRRRRRLSL